jgi:hypothetical protein
VEPLFIRGSPSVCAVPGSGVKLLGGELAGARGV